MLQENIELGATIVGCDQIIFKVNATVVYWRSNVENKINDSWAIVISVKPEQLTYPFYVQLQLEKRSSILTFVKHLSFGML